MGDENRKPMNKETNSQTDGDPNEGLSYSLSFSGAAALASELHYFTLPY